MAIFLTFLADPDESFEYEVPELVFINGLYPEKAITHILESEAIEDLQSRINFFLEEVLVKIHKFRQNDDLEQVVDKYNDMEIVAEKMAKSYPDYSKKLKKEIDFKRRYIKVLQEDE